MMTIIIIAALLGAAILFIFFQIFQFKSGISGTKSALVKDVELLKRHLDQYDLVEWKADELGILSRIGESSLKNELMADVEHGVFYSIYHEPLLAFATKEYRGNCSRVIVLRFNNTDYAYLPDEGHLRVEKNGEKYAQLNDDKGIEIVSDKDSLSIHTFESISMLPVYVNNVQTLSINTDDGSKQSRVINAIKPMAEGQEELLILALVYAILDKQI